MGNGNKGCLLVFSFGVESSGLLIIKTVSSENIAVNKYLTRKSLCLVKGQTSSVELFIDR